MPLSRDLEAYLRGPVGVDAGRIRLICNGVDTERFHPSARMTGLLPDGFAAAGNMVIGAVGRLEPVKDQLTLVKAFVELVRRDPAGARLRLVLVGEGSLRKPIEALLAESGLARQVWLAGDRDDVPALMCAMDLFVLPSLAEGISNTILEAMACGLPVVATRVGGNAELVEEGRTGTLVEPDDPVAMARALAGYVQDSEQCRNHGAAARQRVEEQFSLDGMVARYIALYDELSGRTV